MKPSDIFGTQTDTTNSAILVHSPNTMWDQYQTSYISCSAAVILCAHHALHNECPPTYSHNAKQPMQLAQLVSYTVFVVVDLLKTHTHNSSAVTVSVRTISHVAFTWPHPTQNAIASGTWCPLLGKKAAHRSPSHHRYQPIVRKRFRCPPGIHFENTSLS